MRTSWSPWSRNLAVTLTWVVIVAALCVLIGITTKRTIRYERELAAWRERCRVQGGVLLAQHGSRYVCVKSVP